jgi:hypothetical protein
MTIDKLLGMSADQLDKLTQAELDAYFAPYLNVTRPVKKEKVSADMRSNKAFVNNLERDLERKLKAHGISLKNFA